MNEPCVRVGRMEGPEMSRTSITKSLMMRAARKDGEKGDYRAYALDHFHSILIILAIRVDTDSMDVITVVRPENHVTRSPRLSKFPIRIKPRGQRRVTARKGDSSGSQDFQNSSRKKAVSRSRFSRFFGAPRGFDPDIIRPRARESRRIVLPNHPDFGDEPCRLACPGVRASLRLVSA